MQRRKGGARKPKGVRKPNGDLRDALNHGKYKLPPIWQVFTHGQGLISLVNMVLKAGMNFPVSIIDGSNQPPPTGDPTRVTVVVASPTSVGRWNPWYGNRGVFFLIVGNPKEEDPAIGDVLRCLRNVRIYVHTGDTKEGEITLGGAIAAKNGCDVTYFSKAQNSPLPSNKTVHQFQKELCGGIAKVKGGKGGLSFLGFNATTPKA